MATKKEKKHQFYKEDNFVPDLMSRNDSGTTAKYRSEPQLKKTKSPQEIDLDRLKKEIEISKR